MTGREAGLGPGPFGTSGVLVVGECLVDLAPTAAAATAHGGGGGGNNGAAHTGRQPYQRFMAMPGGSCANVAIGLARLGVRTGFAARIARQGFGPWLRQYLSDNGLDLALSVDAPQPATLAAVTLDDQGRASYTFYGPETADWHWQESELPAANQSALAAYGFSAVHTGSLPIAFEPGGQVLAQWLAKLRQGNDVLISFDPNMRTIPGTDEAAYLRRLEQIIASSHVVKASNEDVEAMYPGEGPLATAKKWLSAGPTLVVITEGPDGATALHRNGFKAHLSPPVIKIADTIGAGDAFSAGLLAYFADRELLHPEGIARAERAELEAALAQAIATGAFTCTRPGADPPDAHELEAFVAQHRGEA
ncbi:MAG: carbohydrate kinase [Acidimicrobiales bacterium]